MIWDAFTLHIWSNMYLMVAIKVVMYSGLPNKHDNTWHASINPLWTWLILVKQYTAKLRMHYRIRKTTLWWRHQMETLSALLAIWAGNSPVTGELPVPVPVTDILQNHFTGTRARIWKSMCHWSNSWGAWVTSTEPNHGKTQLCALYTVTNLLLLAKEVTICTQHASVNRFCAWLKFVIESRTMV